MKRPILLPACFLLLWTLTEGQDGSTTAKETGSEIKVKTISDGIELSCGDGNIMSSSKKGSEKSLKLTYKDEDSGEYTCLTGTAKTPGSQIFVKFRTCDNCVELDEASIAGLVVGNVVATVVIGVAVYLIASQSRVSPVTMEKKRSDRQHLIPNESSNRAPNDHYQPLKGVKKDTYDVLTNTKRR
ncbi:T-cell surface glycoprotein CD3 gamma chain [Halichoeres trimaculatus]|uniref:T-cell surface glycoprotein CD3 gamma chain n=1 Tax=Halichoeres trimaculatus TaxID=147232 RepID=UPI003D9E6E11